MFERVAWTKRTRRNCRHAEIVELEQLRRGLVEPPIWQGEPADRSPAARVRNPGRSPGAMAGSRIAMLLIVGGVDMHVAKVAEAPRPRPFSVPRRRWNRSRSPEVRVAAFLRIRTILAPPYDLVAGGEPRLDRRISIVPAGAPMSPPPRSHRRAATGAAGRGLVAPLPVSRRETQRPLDPPLRRVMRSGEGPVGGIGGGKPGTSLRLAWTAPSRVRARPSGRAPGMSI